ncbi:hypothetical protein WDV93_08465 [Pantoea ananatis]
MHVEPITPQASVLSSRNAGFIIAARFISDFGAFLNMVVLSTYVYVITQSVAHVSVFLASRVAGGIIASVIGIPFFVVFTAIFH